MSFCLFKECTHPDFLKARFSSEFHCRKFCQPAQRLSFRPGIKSSWVCPRKASWHLLVLILQGRSVLGAGLVKSLLFVQRLSILMTFCLGSRLPSPGGLQYSLRLAPPFKQKRTEQTWSSNCLWPVWLPKAISLPTAVGGKPASPRPSRMLTRALVCLRDGFGLRAARSHSQTVCARSARGHPPLPPLARDLLRLWIILVSERSANDHRLRGLSETNYRLAVLDLRIPAWSPRLESRRPGL